jgi:hypothetical protein
LQHASGPDAVWTKPSLDKTEHAPLGEHCVRDYEQHDDKHHRDGREFQCNVNGSLRIHEFIVDCRLSIADLR